jgi:O-antigen biosynthesis protein
MPEHTGAKMQPIPILIYHSVDREFDDRYARWAVSPERFDRHLRYLRAEGWRPITVSTLAGLFAAGAKVPERTVLVTFDDGLRDFLTGAMPILERHGVPATLYVVAGLIGQTSRWLAPLGEGGRAMLTEAELRDLAHAGVEIGAHTMTHPQLDLLAEATARREIAGSRRVLEDCTGLPVTTFAYPHGYQTPKTRALVREAGFSAGCRVRHALSAPGEDLYALSRIIVTEDIDEDGLGRLMSGEELPVAPPVDHVKALGWRLARRAMAKLPQRQPAVP